MNCINMKLRTVLVLLLVFAMAATVFTACVEPDDGGGGQYKDPSDQTGEAENGDGGGSSEDGGNSENNGGENSGVTEDNGDGGQGSGSSEIEFPRVPIE